MRAPVREPNTRYELDPTRRGGGSGAALIYIISRIFLDTDILSFSYGKRDLALLRNFKSFSFLMQRFRGVFLLREVLSEKFVGIWPPQREIDSPVRRRARYASYSKTLAPIALQTRLPI